MLKIVTVTWPWDHNLLTPEGTIQHLKNLGANELCIRTPQYYELYYPDWYDKLVKLSRAENIALSIWPIVSLYYPEKMAESIKIAYTRYKPVRIILDAERSWVLNYIVNLPKFLQALGRMPCPVGLGSYRRASGNPGMHWQEWWTAKTPAGAYIIDFNATQLYPIGWRTSSEWINQMKLDVDSHEIEHGKAGRSTIKWIPWMPAFTQGYFNGSNTELWVPPVDSVKASVEYLQTRLGDRLLGLNWWSLDQDLVKPQFIALYNYIKTTLGNVVPPPQLGQPSLDILWREAKKHPELFDLTP